MNTGTRVVVTGGCGFVGSHLVERLVERGAEVTVFDLAPPPPDQAWLADRVRYVTADVRDPTAIGAVITPDVHTVYHLGGVVGVDRYLVEPLDVIDVTIGGTRHVLERAAQVGAKVVLASTSEVYGKNAAVPWAEDADRVLGATGTDRWVYGSSKAVAEHMTFAFVRQRGLRAAIVRYFNVYGPRQRPAYVISRSIHRALRGLPPERYDSGRQTRCFTFVADAVEATIRAGQRPAADGQAVNIGSAVETPVAAALELIARITGVAGPVVTLDTAAGLGPAYQDIDRRVPDVAKAIRLLGWRHRTPLRAGLEQTVDWAKRNPWWQQVRLEGFG